MKILFRSTDLRRQCNVLSIAQKTWGEAAAVLIRRRLDDLEASRTLKQFLGLPHIRARIMAGAARVHLTEILEMVLSPKAVASGDPMTLSDSRIVIVDGIEEIHGRRRA